MYNTWAVNECQPIAKVSEWYEGSTLKWFDNEVIVSYTEDG